MAYKDNDKKSNNLSYSDWFSFYLSIFTNNIALAQLCAKKAYLNQIYNQEIEDDTEEIDNLLAEINVGLEELKIEELFLLMIVEKILVVKIMS